MTIVIKKGRKGLEKKYSYEEFLEIIATLRSENGCPWDREQTHESLKVNLIEECYELAEAIETNDSHLMEEELGDVLLQIVMHSQIAKEAGEFTMEDVVNKIAEKMVHRHPHVFGEEKNVTTVEEVNENWEKIKRKEKNENDLAGAMDRIAKTLPSLMRAEKIYKKSINAEMKENSAIEQINQLIEDLEELKKRYTQEACEDEEAEIGKILFGVVKLSTFFDINAEFALTKSLEKFINRFRYIENSRFMKG